LLAAAATVAVSAGAAVGMSACGGHPSPASTRATTTAATPSRRIVVNRSVGPISMGLERRAVLRRLGRPLSTLAVVSIGRLPGTMARYRSHGADLLITYDSTGRVVSIEAYSDYYRTDDGVGPGSPLADAAQIPGFRQNSCDLGYWNATERTPRSGVVTVFTPNGGLIASAKITQLRFNTNCAQAGRGLEPHPTIVVDRSVGGISLGLSEPAVDKLLGPPGSRRPVAAGTLARYAVDGAPFLVTYDPAKHVVRVQAFSTFFFSPAGIGPGSPRAFVAALRSFAFDACKTGFWDVPAGAAPTRRVTVFTLHAGKVASVIVAELRLARRCSA
jgi:hypothetical protein